MVPGSTFMYGSSFCTPTLSPRALSSVPSEAAVMPLPSEETTPPVMKMYLADFDSNGSSPTILRPCPEGILDGRSAGHEIALRRLPRVTPLALALVLVAAFAHAGWNALSKRAPGGATFVWTQMVVGSVCMVPVAAAGIRLDDGARVSFVIVLMGIASGCSHTLYFVLLQRG